MRRDISQPQVINEQVQANNDQITAQNQLTSVNATTAMQMQEQLVQQSLNSALQTTITNAGDKSIKEVAKDLTYLKGASDLQQNESFVDTYTKELGGQMIKDLKSEGVQAAIKANARKLEEKNIRNQAFFDGCRPIFKLLGIAEPYGLFPMLITVILLMLPFLAISLIRFVINSINAIFEAISGFKKPAFFLCTIIMIIAVTCAALLGLAALIDAVSGSQIIKAFKDLFI